MFTRRRLIEAAGAASALAGFALVPRRVQAAANINAAAALPEGLGEHLVL